MRKLSIIALTLGIASCASTPTSTEQTAYTLCRPVKVNPTPFPEPPASENLTLSEVMSWSIELADGYIGNLKLIEFYQKQADNCNTAIQLAKRERYD